MIGIAPTSYDPTGALMLKPAAGSNLRAAERRVSRTATLDGGSYVYDTGYAAADRTLTVLADALPAATLDALAALVRTYSTVTVTTDEGAWRATPGGVTTTDGITALTLFITSEA